MSESENNSEECKGCGGCYADIGPLNSKKLCNHCQNQRPMDLNIFQARAYLVILACENQTTEGYEAIEYLTRYIDYLKS